MISINHIFTGKLNTAINHLDGQLYPLNQKLRQMITTNTFAYVYFIRINSILVLVPNNILANVVDEQHHHRQRHINLHLNMC
jgi:hypothetical protein